MRTHHPHSLRSLWNIMYYDIYGRFHQPYEGYGRNGDKINAPPSQLPLAMSLRESGRLARTSTASVCPSKLPTKGCANMRSILAALRARMRSRCLANGCTLGSKFRDVGVGSPRRPGRWSAGECWSTFIFCNDFRGPLSNIESTRTYHSGPSRFRCGSWLFDAE